MADCTFGKRQYYSGGLTVDYVNLCNKRNCKSNVSSSSSVNNSTVGATANHFCTAMTESIQPGYRIWPGLSSLRVHYGFLFPIRIGDTGFGMETKFSERNQDMG